MSAALDLILADTSSMLEVTAEISSAKRSDGTLRTWYVSTGIRETGASETPANTTFLPFLRPGPTLGPLSQSLSEDLLFAGQASESPGTLTLTQNNLDNDQLSEMNDYVFAGYQCVIKIGRNTDLYSSFAVFRTLVISIDPILQLTANGFTASFTLSSVLDRLLKENLIVKRYVGIPHCLRMTTGAAKVTATHQAGHDVARFTIGIRFRMPAPPPAGSTRRIWTKASAGIVTDSHWFIRVGPTGALFLLATSNSAADIQYTSPTNLCNNSFHQVVFSRDNSLTAYVMIDFGQEVFFTLLGVPDLSNAGHIFGEISGTTSTIDICDARFLDRYMPPDEARGYFSTRSNGDDLNVIGLWRFDDNLGGTVNDYSSLNADGTISGVISTDYSWKETDLGEPELSGRSYSINVGNVRNAKADLIDGSRERYRANNDSILWHTSSSNTTLKIKSQGTTLTGGGVDYTAPSDGGDGVFSMTNQESEPVTYDLLNNGTAEDFTYPPLVASRLLTNRTRLAASDIFNANPLLAPWPCGYHTSEDKVAQQALAEILGQSGMYYYEDYLGRLYFDMLIPSTGYGPFNEPVLDFRGQQNGIIFGDNGDISGSCTIAGWIKVNISDQTAFNFGAAEPNAGSLTVVSKQDLTSGNYSVYFQATGSNAGKLTFRIAGITLRTATGVIQPYIWYFVACVFDDTANTMKIYSAPQSGTLAEVASVANTSSPTPNSNPLTIGGVAYEWLSVQYLQVWNSVKTLAQLQSLMAVPPIGNESGLVAYIGANEGSGLPVEIVSQTTGTILDAFIPSPVWAPKLVIDLDETPSVKLTDFHHVHPASEIVVRYAKNYYEMPDSDVDTGVTQNVRLSLTKPGLDVRMENSTVRDRFKNAKKIILDSPLTDQKSAQRLLRVISSRFSTDNYVGVLTFPVGLNISRIACGLTLGDEIGLVGNEPSQIQTPRSFKVVGVSPNPLQLSTSVIILR